MTTETVTGNAVVVEAFVDTQLSYCKNMLPAATVEVEEVEVPYEYEGSTIHVFTDNIIADYDPDFNCTLKNVTVTVTVGGVNEGRIYSSPNGANSVVLCYVEEGTSYVLFSNYTPHLLEDNNAFYYYKRKLTTDDATNFDRSLLILDAEDKPLRTSVKSGRPFVALATGWIAVRVNGGGEDVDRSQMNYISPFRTSNLTEADLATLPAPDEETDTVTFTSAIEGGASVYYDWVSGTLSDGETTTTIEPPFVPSNVDGTYYIYFDEGTASVEYYVKDGDREANPVTLSLGSPIEIITNLDDIPIGSVTPEPDFEFERKG